MDWRTYINDVPVTAIKQPKRGSILVAGDNSPRQTAIGPVDSSIQNETI